MSIRQPLNDGVIRYLERHRTFAEDDRAPRPDHLDYWESGSHPDVVERVWNQLGNALPLESRRVVCGTPALVHPTSKVVIAVSIGTAYALRLAVHCAGVGASKGRTRREHVVYWKPYERNKRSRAGLDLRHVRARGRSVVPSIIRRTRARRLKHPSPIAHRPSPIVPSSSAGDGVTVRIA
jgi:hypothetical protein